MDLKYLFSFENLSLNLSKGFFREEEDIAFIFNRNT